MGDVDKRKITFVGSISIIGLMLVVVLGQLAYSKDRALPFAQINGQKVGGKNSSEIAKILTDDVKDIQLSLVVNGQVRNYKMSDLGGRPKVDVAVSRLSSYRIRERLIPFSLFFVQPKVDGVQFEFESDLLDQELAKIKHEFDQSAQNAQLKIDKNGQLEVIEAKAGYELNIEQLKQTIASRDYKLQADNKIDLTLKTIAPAISSQDVMAVKDVAAKFIERDVKFNYQNVIIETSQSERAAWLAVTEKDNKLQLTISENNFKKFVKSKIDSKLAISAQPKVVTLLDGKVQSTTPGKNGRTTKIKQLLQDLNNNLNTNKQIFAVDLRIVKPIVKYRTNYSHTPVGLQAYLNKLGQNKNIEVSFVKVGDPSWQAQVNANRSTVAASTYKLFIALKVFNDIEAGRLKLDDGFAGQTVESCLNNMIVLSTNKCSEEWLKTWNRRQFNQGLFNQGFSRAVNFLDKETAKNSANDLRLLLLGLEKRTLFNKQHAQHLLGLMKRQVHRRGIPAGTKYPVANKVGFLWDYLHDAAIVYHPRGTYVLVIKTKGQSWSKIANITRQIEVIVYP